MSEKTEVIPPPGSFEGLRFGLESVAEKAIKKDITLRYRVVTNEGTLDREQDEPMFGASLGKLGPAAVRAVDEPESASEIVTVFRSDVVMEGSGDLDFKQTQHQEDPQYPIKKTVAYVLRDMLGKSSNTGWRVLTSNRVKQLQVRYKELGWHNTTVDAAIDWAELGDTTPAEALAQLALLQDLSREGNEVAKAAMLGLATLHDRRHGIGPYLTDEVEVRRKLGQHNGNADYRGIYRHEGAILETRDKLVNHVIMVHSEEETLRKRYQVNGVLLAASGEVANYLELARPRLLGLRALTA